MEREDSDQTTGADELRDAASWCGFERESVWDSMTAEQILTVYRLSADWISLSGWAEEDPTSFREAFRGARWKVSFRRRFLND